MSLQHNFTAATISALDRKCVRHAFLHYVEHRTVSLWLLKFLFQVALVTRPLESLADICTALVSYGGHVHADGLSDSPLHYAVRQNSPSTVAALLSARRTFPDTVKQALATVGLDNETRDNVGKYRDMRPLHTAVRHGYLDCCQHLIDARADVNAVCRDWLFGSTDVTALELAVVTRNIAAVQLLLRSPNCQVNKIGSRRFTALVHAAYQREYCNVLYVSNIVQCKSVGYSCYLPFSSHIRNQFWKACRLWSQGKVRPNIVKSD